MPNIDASRLVEHAVFGEGLVDSRASARRVAFTEDIVKIADLLNDVGKERVIDDIQAWINARLSA